MDAKVIIPVVFIGRGLAGMCGSRVIGRAADKWGVLPCVFGMMACVVVGAVCSLVAVVYSKMASFFVALPTGLVICSVDRLSGA